MAEYVKPVKVPGVPCAPGALGDEAKALLQLVDRVNELRKELVAFKSRLPVGLNHVEKAVKELNDLVSSLRVKVGERVVADWTGVEPERKF
jgi:hypothetical protein